MRKEPLNAIPGSPRLEILAAPFLNTIHEDNKSETVEQVQSLGESTIPIRDAASGYVAFDGGGQSDFYVEDMEALELILATLQANVSSRTHDTVETIRCTTCYKCSLSRLIIRVRCTDSSRSDHESVPARVQECDSATRAVYSHSRWVASDSYALAQLEV